ncbi:MAG: hypothetical protein WA139_04945 [Candidatus Aenigmatarchaeota archaeon]
MADIYAIFSQMKSGAGKTGVVQQPSITEKDIEMRKIEMKHLKEREKYNSIIDNLLEEKNVNALLLSTRYKIEIPKNYAIAAADTIANSCYDDAFGSAVNLAMKIGEFDSSSELEDAALSTYKKYGFDEKATELERYFKQKYSISIR